MAQGQNRHADSLATLALSMTEVVPQMIKMELVVEPSINAVVGVSVIVMSKLCWMDLIINFLAEDRVLDDEKDVGRVREVAAWYWLSVDRKLYRRSFGGPYLLCLSPKKVNELLAELPEGVCNNHVGGCSLAHRVMT